MLLFSVGLYFLCWKNCITNKSVNNKNMPRYYIKYNYIILKINNIVSF